MLPSSTDQGYLVNCVLVMEHITALEEFYISIQYDRKRQQPVIIYSKHGGLILHKIEQLYPDSVHKIYFDANEGLDFVGLSKIA